MGKLSKFFLVFSIMFLIIIIALYMVYVTTFKANNQLCQQLLVEPSKNSNFFDLMEQLSEKTKLENAQKIGSSSKGTWRDLDYVYIILNDVNIIEIYENPTKYFSDALKVIASPDFDQSQKIYTILMMQELPIKEYMCLMDTANTAYEKGIITDKEVLMQAIDPDINLESTSNNYWWLPDWQQRFKKHANELFTQEHIGRVLSGKHSKIIEG